MACGQELSRCALSPHALPHTRCAQSCETLCPVSSDLLSSNWTVELTCSINSRFGFGDVRTGIFELTPLTAQGFTGAFRDHFESGDRKLLVRLRTLAPLLIK
jgi:hypothetical protein